MKSLWAKSDPKRGRGEIRSDTYLTCPRRLGRRWPTSLLHSWPCWGSTGEPKPLNYQEWSTRTVPSSCLQLHRVIVTSMQSLGKSSTGMELWGARLSPSPSPACPLLLLFFFFLNNHHNWCCAPALNVTPLTHLAHLFVQNLPPAFWLQLFASNWQLWDCKRQVTTPSTCLARLPIIHFFLSLSAAIVYIYCIWIISRELCFAE